MAKKKKADIAVIGAGIMGLAITYAAAKKGLKVVLFERNPKALGASIRNFGLVWPIGQGAGVDLERALNSRKRWIKLAAKAGFWINQNGSIHLAYHQDEWDVLQEFMQDANSKGYYTRLVKPDEVHSKTPAAQAEGLMGGLWSSTELTINPLEAIRKIPDWLSANFNVKLRYNTTITGINTPKIEAGNEQWKVQETFICNGTDFETLYPDVFAQSGLLKCKLQMMKTMAQPDAFLLGPALCSGLSMRYHDAFAHCPSIHKLNSRIQTEWPDVDTYGVQVIVVQNSKNEIIIGDSHQFDLAHDPFNEEKINQLILNYFQTFAHIPNLQISYRWNGLYAKSPDGYFLNKPEKNVTIVNGLGGKGMTIALALGEELVDNATE